MSHRVLAGDQRCGRGSVPHVLAVGGREVDLVTQLTNEPDPQDEAVHAGDRRLFAVEIGEGVVGAVAGGAPAGGNSVIILVNVGIFVLIAALIFIRRRISRPSISS